MQRSLIPAFLFAALQPLTSGTTLAAAPMFAVPPDAAVRFQRIEDDAAARTPAQKKMSLELLYSIRAALGRPPIEGIAGTVEFRAADAQSRLLVTIAGRITPEFEAFVAAQGGVAITSLPEYHALSARIPAANIEAVAARSEVAALRLAQPMRHAQVPPEGPQDPEGDLAHAAAQARADYDTDGSGVKVCVMSDDNGWYTNAVENGSLPAGMDTDPSLDPVGADGYVLPPPSESPAPVRRDDEPTVGSHEGTAMLEIVHRIAPGAALGFASGDGGDTAMAKNMKALATTHACNIIVDDLSYVDEPPFQDGSIARAMSDASRDGVLMVSSAGNNGNLGHGTTGTWEGDFVPGSGPVVTIGSRQYELMSFVPGGQVYWNSFSDLDESEGPANTYLYWNDPVCQDPDVPCDGADYRLIVSADGHDVQGASVPDADGAVGEAHLPSALGLYIGVGRNVTSPGRYVRIATFGSKLHIGTGGATAGHNASSAENALTVAAVTAADRTGTFPIGVATFVEDYSSDGRRLMFYDRDGNLLGSGLTAAGGVSYAKPDVSAADCITTDVPEFAPFCGTSAAAPHIAAIGALAMAKYPSAETGQIRSMLLGTSGDIEVEGWDPLSGVGIAFPGQSVPQSSVLWAVDFRRPQVVYGASYSELLNPSRIDTACPQRVFTPTQAQDLFRVDFQFTYLSRPMNAHVLYCLPGPGQIARNPVATLNGTVLAMPSGRTVTQNGQRYLDMTYFMPMGTVAMGANALVFSTGEMAGPIDFPVSAILLYPGFEPPQ